MTRVDNDTVFIRIRRSEGTPTPSNHNSRISIPLGGEEPEGYNIDEFLSQLREEERAQAALELDEKKPEYIIKALSQDISPAVIKKSGQVTSDGKEIFIAATECKDGELVEKYYALEGNKFVEYQKSGETYTKTGTSLKPSELQSKVAEALRIKEEIENANSAYEAYLEGNMNGGKVFTCIKGATEDRYYNKINKSLKNLNKDNVVQFLSSYYDKSKYNGNMKENDGLLEWLDEEYDDGVVEMEGKKNLVKSLMEKAKELGLDKCDAYLDIQEIMSYYDTDEAFEDAETFRGSSWKGSKGRNFAIGVGDTAAGAAAGAVVGGIVGAAVAVVGGLFSGGIAWAAVGAAAGTGAKIGAWIGTGVSCLVHHTQVMFRWGKAGKRTDSEILDSAMFELHKEILKKMGS